MDTSLSSKSTVSLPSRLESLLLSGLSDACRYGRRNNRILCNIMPSDHMSDFESTWDKRPVTGEGSDSGDAYSSLEGNQICQMYEGKAEQLYARPCVS